MAAAVGLFPSFSRRGGAKSRGGCLYNLGQYPFQILHNLTIFKADNS